jgi:diguanylate cyclase (GGDEF)-like protein/PAS domain S-box-containing protein
MLEKLFNNKSLANKTYGSVDKLRDEVELLTSYSTDTIYRLRYDSMEYDYISASCIRLLGFMPDELKKISFRSLIVETKIVDQGMRSVDSFDVLEKNRRSGEVCKWQADYKIRTKDGRLIWVSDVSYPWFDGEGNIIGSIGVLRDISDRVHAEAKAREELVKLANTDQLTGLANRRVFFERLDEEIKRIRRNRRPFSILLIDLDHFKQINDNYGHDVGDSVLIEVAAIIRSCLRETDMAARLGGEEFGVFLPDTPAEGAFWVADRMRLSVAKKQFAINKGILEGIHTTISVGISETDFENNNLNSATLYKEADTRLYIAKNTGRNQVSVDEIVSMH